MEYKLTETEKFYPDYCHEETFPTLKEAQARMKDLYRQLVIEGDYDNFEKAMLYERSAFVLVNDGNEISWDIETIE